MDRPSSRGRVSLPSRYRDGERPQLLPGRPRNQTVERPGRCGRNPNRLTVAKSVKHRHAGTLTFGARWEEESRCDSVAPRQIFALDGKRIGRRVRCGVRRREPWTDNEWEACRE